MRRIKRSDQRKKEVPVSLQPLTLADETLDAVAGVSFGGHG